MLRSVLSRLVGQMDMWTQAVQHRPYDFAVERDDPLRSSRARLDRAGTAFVEQAREVIAGAGTTRRSSTRSGARAEVFTYGGMLAHVLTFAAHHRLLAIGALHSAGITDLGAGDPMRWVAEAA